MQMRETGESILKRCCNEGTKEIALTETEFKNRDHNGGIYKEKKKRGPKCRKGF